MASSSEVPALRPASSVRSDEVRLVLGSRHRELGGATSMALITLERARKQGLIRGRGLQNRLRLGAEMLIDRACPEGGWNAIIMAVRRRRIGRAPKAAPAHSPATARRGVAQDEGAGTDA
jgi:hypothetical protein